MSKIAMLIVASCTLFWGTNFENDRHVGKWSGEDNGDFGSMILDAEGYATFEFDGRTMGGNGKTGERSLEYKIDYNTDPIEIDFIMKNVADASELGRLRGIIEFLTKDQMKLAIQFDPSASRPTDFAANAITLNRVE
ncbi:MAG: hypothetical protein AAFX87_22400 [Bacteroidota bacterium]